MEVKIELHSGLGQANGSHN